MRLMAGAKTARVGLEQSGSSEGCRKRTDSGRTLVVRMVVRDAAAGRGKAVQVGMGRDGPPVTHLLGWRLHGDRNFGEFCP